MQYIRLYTNPVLVFSRLIMFYAETSEINYIRSEVNVNGDFSYILTFADEIFLKAGKASGGGLPRSLGTIRFYSGGLPLCCTAKIGDCYAQ